MLRFLEKILRISWCNNFQQMVHNADRIVKLQAFHTSQQHCCSQSVTFIGTIWERIEGDEELHFDYLQLL